MGKPKKGKKKDVDWEDDVLNDLDSLKDGEPDKKENTASKVKENKPSGGRFQGLNIEDDGPAEDDGDDDLTEMVTSSQKSKKQKKKKDVEATKETVETESLATGNVDDLQTVDNVEEENGNGLTDEPSLTTSKKSKKKKKDKKDFDFDLEGDSEDEKVKPVKKTDDAAKKPEEVTVTDEGTTGVKTAAQKRAEKKEREKKKKEAEKAKAKTKVKKDESKPTTSADDKTEEGKVEVESSADKEAEVAVTSKLSGDVGDGGTEKADELEDKEKKKKEKEEKRRKGREENKETKQSHSERDATTPGATETGGRAS